MNKVANHRARPIHWLGTALALRCAAALLLGVEMHAAIAAPDDPASSDWGVSGFGTVGLLSQSGESDWGFMRSPGQSATRAHIGAATDSRAGIQLNWRSGSTWDAAVQAVWLDRPAGAKAVEALEWAYLGYRPLPNLRLRVGRTSPEIFLFSDTRNVGFALPWVRPPVELYGIAPTVSLDGADLEWQMTSGEAAWRTRIAVGRIDSSYTEKLTGQGMALNGRGVMALTVARESEGLTLKASYARSKSQGLDSPQAVQFREALTQLGSLPVPGLGQLMNGLQSDLTSNGVQRYAGLGLQYEEGPWSIYAEASVLHMEHTLIPSRRGYAGLGHRSGEVTFYGLVGRSRPKRAAKDDPDVASLLAPVIGPEGAQGAQILASTAASVANAYRSDQESVAVGLRWDFSSRTALKFQIDRVHVFPNGSGMWLYGDSRAANVTLGTVLLDFVWGQ